MGRFRAIRISNRIKLNWIGSFLPRKSLKKKSDLTPLYAVNVSSLIPNFAAGHDSGSSFCLGLLLSPWMAQAQIWSGSMNFQKGSKPEIGKFSRRNWSQFPKEVLSSLLCLTFDLSVLCWMWEIMESRLELQSSSGMATVLPSLSQSHTTCSSLLHELQVPPSLSLYNCSLALIRSLASSYSV